jgi:MFS family permease
MILAFAIASTQQNLTVVMFVCFILAGCGYSVALVNLYPYILELSDPNKLGKTTGIFNTVMTLAMVFTPVVSGILQDNIGLYTLFPYCLTSLIIATVLLFFIKEKKRGATA